MGADLTFYPYSRTLGALMVSQQSANRTRVAPTKVTTLRVTHGIEEAIRLADHIFLLTGHPTGIVVERDIIYPHQAMTDAYAAQTKIEIAAILTGAAAG